MHRKKPDKWRNMLKAAEEASAQKAAEVAALLKAQEVLIWRQEAVNRIVDSFSLMDRIIAETQGPTTQCIREWRQIEQHLQSCLYQVGGRQLGSSLQPHTLTYFRAILNPDYVQQVLSMSDTALLQRIRFIMGKCAIMVVQNQAACAWQDPQDTAPAAAASQQHQQQPQPAAAYLQACQAPPGFGHPLMVSCEPQQPSSSTQGRPSSTTALHPTPGAPNASTGTPCSTDTNQFSSGCSSCPAPWQLGPAFEVSAIWGVLFNHDEARFLRLISMDLETCEEFKLTKGPGFGLWLASMLQLRPEQVCVLKGLRDLVQQPHEALPGQIREVTVQQQVLTLQQETQVPSWTNDFASAEQVHAAHEQALQQQADALRRFRLIAKFMGLVTLNTLSPAQLATLHACSWPSVSRIEPVLDVLDHLQPATA